MQHYKWTPLISPVHQLYIYWGQHIPSCSLILCFWVAFHMFGCDSKLCFDWQMTNLNHVTLLSDPSETPELIFWVSQKPFHIPHWYKVTTSSPLEYCSILLSLLCSFRSFVFLIHVIIFVYFPFCLNLYCTFNAWLFCCLFYPVIFPFWFITHFVT